MSLGPLAVIASACCVALITFPLPNSPMYIQVRIALVVGLVLFAAIAQEDAVAPVHLVVPYPAGSTPDIIANAISGPLSEALGQRVVIENRMAEADAIGVGRGMPPRRYLGLANISTASVMPTLNPAAPYESGRDVTPIIEVASAPNVLAVHHSFPASTYAQFVQQVRNSPQPPMYASGGIGSTGHLQMELVKALTGLNLVHEPFYSEETALSEVVNGNAAVYFGNLNAALPFIKNGRLIPLAVAARDRHITVREVPTFYEVGLMQANRPTIYGVYGPKGMPSDVVAKLNESVKTALKQPAVRSCIERMGASVMQSTPEQLAADMEREYEVYREFARSMRALPTETR